MQKVPFIYDIEGMPKIKSFGELKSESYCNQFDEADLKPNWRMRFVKFFWPDVIRDAVAVRRENDHLRERLLAAYLACEAAGRNGLTLYAENELLREQVETTPQKRLVRLHELDQLANENRDLRDKLKRAYTDYERLHSDVQAWINQFGKPKE
jgi:hypothetical protein